MLQTKHDTGSQHVHTPAPRTRSGEKVVRTPAQIADYNARRYARANGVPITVARTKVSGVLVPGAYVDPGIGMMRSEALEQAAAYLNGLTQLTQTASSPEADTVLQKIAGHIEQLRALPANGTPTVCPVELSQQLRQTFDMARALLPSAPVKTDWRITKADTIDGVRMWQATTTKFARDVQGDLVTRGFYETAIKRFKSGAVPPAFFSVAHYPLEHTCRKCFTVYKSVMETKCTACGSTRLHAGITTDIWIDGDQPKAAGIFFDTPLGLQTYKACQEDVKKSLPSQERVRISMGFYPDPDGVVIPAPGQRNFLTGWIEHFAGTRVPVVAETNIEVKSMLPIVTRRQDAESFIEDKALVTELESVSRANKAGTTDGMVWKAQGDTAEERPLDIEADEAERDVMGHAKEERMKEAAAMQTANDNVDPRMKAQAMLAIAKSNVGYLLLNYPHDTLLRKSQYGLNVIEKQIMAPGSDKAEILARIASLIQAMRDYAHTLVEMPSGNTTFPPNTPPASLPPNSPVPPAGQVDNQTMTTQDMNKPVPPQPGTAQDVLNPPNTQPIDPAQQAEDMIDGDMPTPVIEGPTNAQLAPQTGTAPKQPNQAPQGGKAPENLQQPTGAKQPPAGQTPGQMPPTKQPAQSQPVTTEQTQTGDEDPQEVGAEQPPSASNKQQPPAQPGKPVPGKKPAPPQTPPQATGEDEQPEDVTDQYDEDGNPINGTEDGQQEDTSTQRPQGQRVISFKKKQPVPAAKSNPNGRSVNARMKPAPAVKSAAEHPLGAYLNQWSQTLSETVGQATDRVSKKAAIEKAMQAFAENVMGVVDLTTPQSQDDVVSVVEAAVQKALSEQGAQFAQQIQQMQVELGAQLKSLSTSQEAAKISEALAVELARRSGGPQRKSLGAIRPQANAPQTSSGAPVLSGDTTPVARYSAGDVARVSVQRGNSIY